MKKSQKVLFVLGIVILLFVASVIVVFGTKQINHWRKEESKKLLIESQNNTKPETSLVLLQKATLLDHNDRSYLMAGAKAKEAGLENLATFYFKRVKTAEGYKELGNIYSKNGQYSQAETAYKKSLEKDENNDIWLLIGKNYYKLAKINEAKDAFEQSSKLDRKNLEAEYYKFLTELIVNENAKIDTGLLDEDKKKELQAVIQSPTSTTIINRLFQLLKELDYPQLAYNYLDSKAKDSKLDRDGYLLIANEYFIRKKYEQSYQLLLKAKEIDPYYTQTYQHLIEITNLLNKKDESKKYQEFLEKITW